MSEFESVNELGATRRRLEQERIELIEKLRLVHIRLDATNRRSAELKRSALRFANHSPSNPCRCSGPSWKPHDADCALWKVAATNNKEDRDWCADCGANFRGHPEASPTQHMFTTAAGLQARRKAEATIADVLRARKEAEAPA